MKINKEKIQAIIEDYGLGKLIEEVQNDQTLSKQEAIKYLESIKNKNVGN